MPTLTIEQMLKLTTQFMCDLLGSSHFQISEDEKWYYFSLYNCRKDAAKLLRCDFMVSKDRLENSAKWQFFDVIYWEWHNSAKISAVL